MSNTIDALNLWRPVQDYFMNAYPDATQYVTNGALTFELDEEDWQLEITPEGLLICQAGYSLEDMQSLLSDGTPEDLGTDELAKQTKFYIQQVVSKYRNHLKQNGFTERIEMNDEYVAVFFERPIDLAEISNIEKLINEYQRLFSKKS